MDEIYLDIDKKKKSILDDISTMNSDDVPLISDLYTVSKKKNKKHKEYNEDDDFKVEAYDWDNVINSIKKTKHNKKKFKNDDIFGDIYKKKKKKKKKDGSGIDYKKDFEPELILLKNLQADQNKFVNSLQKKYDQLDSVKSTARGVSKYTTDLIQSISNARSVSMQLIDKITGIKKTVADLNFKERKEFGSASNSEQVNINNYASTYLKKMLDSGRTSIQNTGYIDMPDTISEDDDYELFNSINESLGDVERDEDVEKYLKYENKRIDIIVKWHDYIESDDITDKYDYIAVDSDGNVVDDYPLPKKGRININKSTGFATDEFGNKYKLFID